MKRKDETQREYYDRYGKMYNKKYRSNIVTVKDNDLATGIECSNLYFGFGWDEKDILI